MGFFSNLTPGRIAGWMMLSFVAAIGVHSLLPFWKTSDVLLAVLLVGSVLGSVVIRHRFAIPILLIVASVTFGWWRFERAPTPKLRRIGSHQLIIRTLDENSVFAKLRQRFTARIQSVLPSEDANLVSGMLYGDQDLTTLQKQRFRSAGLMHLVAVSGSNVTVVVQFIVLLALGMKFHRRKTFWITSLALVLFVCFVGFSASVARAALMGWLFLIAREVGRPASSSRLLLVAATILLLFNPWQLFFDAGFALSFLAMWGLLVWAPIIESHLAFLPKKFEIRTTLSMTLAATLATAPYQAWAFGNLSLAGLFTNVLALPLVPFVMGWGMMTAVWGELPGHFVVSTPTLGLVRVIDVIASLADKTPWLQFELKDVSLASIAAIYLVMVYFARLLSKKNGLSTRKEVENEK
ncbi:MAG: ComEC/Rec2 family competence protein [Patescibacteria group bacterium]